MPDSPFDAKGESIVDKREELEYNSTMAIMQILLAGELYFFSRATGGNGLWIAKGCCFWYDFLR